MAVPVLSSIVTVSFVHFMRNLPPSLARLWRAQPSQQMFSMQFARRLERWSHLPDKLHDRVSAIAQGLSGGCVVGVRSVGAGTSYFGQERSVSEVSQLLSHVRFALQHNFKLGGGLAL